MLSESLIFSIAPTTPNLDSNELPDKRRCALTHASKYKTPSRHLGPWDALKIPTDKGGHWAMMDYHYTFFPLVKTLAFLPLFRRSQVERNHDPASKTLAVSCEILFVMLRLE